MADILVFPNAPTVSPSLDDPPEPEVFDPLKVIIGLEHEIAELRHTVALQSMALWTYDPLRSVRRCAGFAALAFFLGWLGGDFPEASAAIMKSAKTTALVDLRFMVY